MPKKMERIWQVVSWDGISGLNCKDEDGRWCFVKHSCLDHPVVRPGDLILVEEFWESTGLRRKVVDRA